jgi:hypothetical protein
VSAHATAAAASQFPNLRGVANSGSLPLGAVFEPFATPATPPPLLRREPVRCQICGAFANRFCDVDGRNGRWRCLFCNAASFCREFVGDERAVRVGRWRDPPLHPEAAKHTRRRARS